MVANADEAEDLYQRGKTLYAERNLAEAERTFEQALALRRSYDVAAQLGGVKLELEKYVEAAEHLTFAVENWAPSGNPAGKESTRARLDKALEHVGWVVLTTNVGETEITVDGAPVGDRRRIFLEPGSHRIEGRKAGYAAASHDVQIEVGQEVPVALDLTPLDDAQPRTEDSDKTAPIAVTVVGAVLSAGALGAAVGLLVAGKGKEDDALALEATCPAPCPAVQSTYADADTLLNAAGGLAIAGGALAVGTIIFAAITLPDDGPNTALVPIVTPGFAGLQLIGGF